MNVTLEDLSPCKKLLRVEYDAPEVDAAYASVTTEVHRHAQLPGFRPGKAPKALIERTFGPKIEAEVKRKLIPEGYNKAVEQKKLRPVATQAPEEGTLGRGQPFSFTVTVETEPDFETPEYKGLTLRRENRVTTEEDVDRAIDMLRGERATFQDMARPVQPGDYVVVNYVGTCEGRPITDLAPNARRLAAENGFWLHVEPGHFMPGFTDQLVGANAGERRAVQVRFPNEFVEPALAGKAGHYEVTVLQVKEKVLPPLDDDFAKHCGAPNVEVLRAGVQRDLQNELKYKQKRELREQIITLLINRVSFELPEAMVKDETRSAVYDIVRANTERGVSKETMDQHKDEIYNMATRSAKDRVRISLILRRIAEKEEIKVSREELMKQVNALAAQHQMKPERMLRQLQERRAVEDIAEQILTSKMLDWLELHAQIQEAPGAPR